MHHEPDEAPPRAKDLRTAYRNCVAGPLRADHPWYVDFGPARGGSPVGRMERALEFKVPGVPGQPDTWSQGLLIGSRGSGKSTELQRLAAQVRHRYEVVLLEANTAMNLNQFEPAELVLSIAVGVEQHMRVHEQKPLPAKHLEQLVDWFSKVTRFDLRSRVQEATVEGKLEGDWHVLGSVQAMMRVQSELRQEVVSELQRYPRELVAQANTLLAAAAKQLGQDRELLVIVDNLDRYAPDVVHRSLCDGRDLLRDLDTNLLLTPPVSLAVNPIGEPLDQLYDPLIVMHTPTLRAPDDPPETVKDPGLDLFLKALDKRLDRAAIFDQPADTVPHLLQLTGGSLRDLWEHLKQATLVATGSRITRADLDEALRLRRSMMRDQIDVSGMAPLLVHIEKTGQLTDDPNAMVALYRRWVLKYNGTEWYALHPYVRGLPRIQSLLRHCDDR